MSKRSNMWCHYCHKNNHNTADCREIAKFKKQKKVCFESKAGPGKKSFAFLVLFEILMHSKGSWSLKRLQAVKRAQKKAESILSTEINLTTSSEEHEDEKYLFTSSKSVSSSKTKVAKSSHPTNNHWVGCEKQFSLSTMRNICSEH
jgi:hypothetical protein